MDKFSDEDKEQIQRILRQPDRVMFVANAYEMTLEDAWNTVKYWESKAKQWPSLKTS